MRIGCNYSEELLELIKEDRVNVDYIKLGDFGPFKEVIDKVIMIKPLLIHGFGFFEHAGMKMNINIDWDSINEKLIRYKCPHLAFHFSVYNNDVDTSEDEKVIINRMINTTKIWSNNIQIPLLIENMDYCPYYSNRLASLSFSSKPEVINHVCEEANVDLLLDIAHAKVSAYHLNQNIYDYIDRLPLNRIKEIHITGTQRKKDTGIVDSHVELIDEDYKLLKYILLKSNPEIITLEYGWPGRDFEWRTKKESIELQLNELKKFV